MMLATSSFETVDSRPNRLEDAHRSLVPPSAGHAAVDTESR